MVRVIILVAFGIVLLFALVVFVSGTYDIPRLVALLEWCIRLFGLFIATTAALLLLVEGVGAMRYVERIAVLAIALLGGLMLITSNWGLALATGAIVVAMFWRGSPPAIPPAGPDE